MEPSDESSTEGRGWTHPSEYASFDGARREPPASLGRGLLAASAVVGAVIGLTTVWLVVPTEIDPPTAQMRPASTTPVSQPLGPSSDGAADPTDGDPSAGDPSAGDPSAGGSTGAGAGVSDGVPSAEPTGTGTGTGDSSADAVTTIAADTAAPPATDTAVPFTTDVGPGAGSSGNGTASTVAPGGTAADAPTGAVPDAVPDAVPATDTDDGLAWVGLGIGTRDGSVEVLTVHADSPAERAGFSVGHRIVAVDGRPVGTAAALIGYLVTCHPGERVTFDVHDRDHRMVRFSVELGAIRPSV